MTPVARVGARCAAHPARLAAGACPVCGRDRCAVDVTDYGAVGCSLCATRTASPPAGPAEILVRVSLAALAVALLAGWVAAQYVNVKYWSIGWPALLGLGVSGAASAAAGSGPGRRQRVVLGASAIVAVLGTALGFRLFDRPVTPVHPWHQVGPPYLAALIGVLGWPLLFGAPGRSRAGRQPARGSGIDL
jgi:hypothetical protein